MLLYCIKLSKIQKVSADHQASSHTGRQVTAAIDALQMPSNQSSNLFDVLSPACPVKADLLNGSHHSCLKYLELCQTGAVFAQGAHQQLVQLDFLPEAGGVHGKLCSEKQSE